MTLQIDHVHRAAGAVPGDERDAVGVGLELEVDVGHERLPLWLRGLARQLGYGSPDLWV